MGARWQNYYLAESEIISSVVAVFLPGIIVFLEEYELKTVEQYFKNLNVVTRRRHW